ncbi:mitogen-activated protein kinase kinase kinase 12-like [Mizuhopecten yessoensis]|uniref:mitogen-activated protein kinase kinase kinase 12-like n=1 Tax=Mizuhopecten yessoensis TaxID=6573 RepID=UPI000B4589B2|nr:mitogen-activated protein kinase kinase kinase 12-like [Mizuhopecten yessoensis]
MGFIVIEFLAQKGFVHRDLAARNILVGRDKTVKVGDFGLTRFVYNDAVYVNRKGGRLPLKWMSIEAICELTFSSASDVWSFGVVLFEVVTLGGTPYPTVDMHDLLRLLRQGYRMEKPPNCSWKLYNIMLSCWNELPKARPSFTDLKSTLDGMLENECGVDYLSMDIDNSQCYYTVTCTYGQDESALRYEHVDTVDGDTDEAHGVKDLQCEHVINQNTPKTLHNAKEINDNDSSEEETRDHEIVVHKVQIEHKPRYLEHHDSCLCSSLAPVQCVDRNPLREHRDSGFDTSSYSGSSPNGSPRTLSSRGSHKESIGMEDEVFIQDFGTFSDIERNSVSLKKRKFTDERLTSSCPICKTCLLPLNEEFHFCENYTNSDSSGCSHHGVLSCDNFILKSRLDETEHTEWYDTDASVCYSSMDTLVSLDGNTLSTYL